MYDQTWFIAYGSPAEAFELVTAAKAVNKLATRMIREIMLVVSTMIRLERKATAGHRRERVAELARYSQFVPVDIA